MAHSWWLLHARMTWKEYSRCFSLTTTSSNVSCTSYSPNWITNHSMIFFLNLAHRGCISSPYLTYFAKDRWLLASRWWACWLKHKMTQCFCRLLAQARKASIFHIATGAFSLKREWARLSEMLYCRIGLFVFFCVLLGLWALSF